MKHLFCISLAVLSFLFLKAQPIVTSFSPLSGGVGTALTITGSNFSSLPADNLVFIGGVRVPVTLANATTLQVTVAAGAISGQVAVAVSGLVGYSTQPFSVTFNGASPTFTPGSFGYFGSVDSDYTTGETTNFTTADLDNDGKPDVLVVDRLTNTLSVYRNTTAGTQLFGTKLDLPTGSSPRFVATGDLDGDGRLDIVVSNLTANTVSVYRNTTVGGALSFAAKVDFATATQPAGIAIADMDRDGRIDLVVNTINTNGWVSVLRNTTTGSVISFASRLDLEAIGGSIEEIAVADLNADGYPDICLPNFSLNSLTVFQNTSTANNVSFAAKADFATGANPSNIAVGDANNDGKPDVMLTYYAGNYNVSQFRNTSTTGGAISFAPRVDQSTGGLPYAVALHDLNGDGKADIVVSAGSDTAAVLQNNSVSGGALTFLPPVRFGALWQGPVRIADVDADGKPDLAFRSGALRVTFWKNKTTEPYIESFTPQNGGTGTVVTIRGVNLSNVATVTFGNQAAASFTVSNATTITAVVGAGASGDVVVSGPTGASRKSGFVYYPTPVITSFTPTTGTTGTVVQITGSNFTAASAVSFGGVPATSFVVVSPTQINAVVNTGAAGAVSVTTPGGTATANGFTYVPPIAVSSFLPQSGGPGTVLTISGNNFYNIISVTIGGAAAASFTVISPTSITAIVGAGNSGTVVVKSALSTGSATGFVFLPPSPPVVSSFSPATGSPGTAVTISGTNFNIVPAKNIVYFGAARALVQTASATQLVVVVPDGSTHQPITVYNADTYVSGASALPFIATFADGSQQFTPFSFPKSNFTTAFAAGFLSLSDVDGDGKTDVLCGTSGNGVFVMRNTSSGGTASFSNQQVEWANAFYGVAAADLDGDGLPDFAATNNSYSISGISSVVFYRNRSTPGTVAFDAGKGLETQVSTSGLAVGDLDRDGKTDVVVTNTGSASVSIFRNTSTPGSLSFAARTDWSVIRGSRSVALADLNGDGKLDVIVSGSMDSTLTILQNATTTSGAISFLPALNIHLQKGGNGYITVGDLDNDGRPDLVSTNGYTSATVSLLRNTSTQGQLQFAAEQTLTTLIEPLLATLSDLNGDGKLDIAVSHGTYGFGVSVYKNLSTPGTIAFDAYSEYLYPSNSFFGIASGDVDGDGKADLLVSNQQSTVSVLKNRSADYERVSACAGATVTVNAGISGASYQWQVNAGSGFVNLSNNATYSNTTGATLQITAVSLGLHNYQYRCQIGAAYSKIMVLSVSPIPAPVVISASGPTTFCAGETVTLTAASSGCTNCNYTWSNGATGPQVVATTSGNYIATAANSCGSTTASKQVTVKPNPSLTLNTQDTSLCAGRSVQLSVTGATTYLWIPSASLSSSTAATVQALPTANTTYTVIGTTDGCSSQKQVRVTVIPVATPTITVIYNGCTSGAAAFSAQVTNGGPTPKIDWYVNGALAGTGLMFSVSGPPSNAQVYATLASSLRCVSADTVTATPVVVNCITTALPVVDGLEELVVSPNPAREVATIKIKLVTSKRVSVSLFTHEGLEVATTDFGRLHGTVYKPLALHGLASGLYYLRFFIDGTAVTKKLLIVH